MIWQKFCKLKRSGARLMTGAGCFLLFLQTGWAFDAVTDNLLRLRYLLPGSTMGGKAAAELDWASLPPAVDLRGEMEDLQVNFIQQGNRNSCAAFSATSVLEFQLRRLGNNIDISEQYTLWAAQKAGANPSMGLTIQQLATGFHLYKVCREEVMPYKNSDTISEPTDLALEDARKMPDIVMDSLVEFRGRVGQSPEDIFRICKMLAKRQPVCLAAEWGDSEATLNAQNELIEGPMAGGHMIILTGYKISPTNPMEGHFLLRNSWGMSWGDFGYAKMPFSYARKHAMEAVVFRFQPPDKIGASLANVSKIESINQIADGLEAYLGLTTTIGLFAALFAVYLTTWIVGKHHRRLRAVLFYLPGALIYFGVLAMVSSVMVRKLEMSDFAWAGGLCLIFFALLFRWIKVTGQRFELNPGRAVSFLVVAMVIWNLFTWSSQTFLPLESFQTWKTALRWASPVDLAGLLEAGTQERRVFLEMNRAPSPVEPELPSDVNQKWLLAWSQELKQEQSLLRKDHPMAVNYFKQRIASYEQQRRSYLSKTPNARLTGLNLETSGNPAQIQADPRLWKMFNDLQKEKAALDPKDAAAVAMFNQKAAEYQSLKASQSR